MGVRPEDLGAAMLRRREARLAREAARGEEVRDAVRRVAVETRAAGVIQRAWLIGSLARGLFGEGSDADVVVEGLDPANLGALYVALVDAAGTEVDLLRLEDLPSDFRASVLAEGESLA